MNFVKLIVQMFVGMIVLVGITLGALLVTFFLSTLQALIILVNAPSTVYNEIRRSEV